MSHLFDPGYGQRPFAGLVANYPGSDVYPAEDFRLEWGPIFHRGRLDGSARILVLGQDPAAHEAISRRILIGEAGQRIQGFLAKLGIETSYVMVNTFLYSVYGQWGGQKHDGDPNIAHYRNDWLDALLVGTNVTAVVALGTLAHHAFDGWASTPNAAGVDVTFQPIKHPTFPEAASAGGQMTRADAMRLMLGEWNTALGVLHASDRASGRRPTARAVRRRPRSGYRSRTDPRARPAGRDTRVDARHRRLGVARRAGRGDQARDDRSDGSGSPTSLARRRPALGRSRGADLLGPTGRRADPRHERAELAGKGILRRGHGSTASPVLERHRYLKLVRAGGVCGRHVGFAEGVCPLDHPGERLARPRQQASGNRPS